MEICNIGTAQKYAFSSFWIANTHSAQVTFDPKRVTYRELLDIFMKGHDPTQENGQGGDIGSQYRSGIYYHTPDQKAAAEQYLGAAQTAYKV